MMKKLMRLGAVLLVAFTLQIVNAGSAEAYRCPAGVSCVSFQTSLFGRGEDIDNILLRFSGDGQVELQAESNTIGDLGSPFGLGLYDQLFANYDSTLTHNYFYFSGEAPEVGYLSNEQILDALILDTDSLLGFYDSTLIKDRIGPTGAFSLSFLDNTLTESLTLDGGPTFSRSITFAAAPVPEPSTILLLGIGLTGLVALNFRMRKKS